MLVLSNIMFTAFCKKAYETGYVYWYGTYGKKCTKSLYEYKKKQYPSHYGESRTEKYMKQIKEGKTCADCIGLAKNFVWASGEFGANPKYAVNGMPDKSANGMFEYAKKKGLPHGKISTIPETPGVAVRYNGHVGYYIGDGWVIEERGFNYGCVKTRLKDRNWTDWYYLPGITYNSQTEIDIPEVHNLGSRVLKNGMEGDDVKEMQSMLIALGYDLGSWGADGDFGDATQIALKKFQKDHKLSQTGTLNKATYEKLNETYVALGSEVITDKKFVEIVGGNCYVRSAPSVENGKILGVATKGSEYVYQGETSDDGWHLIDFKNKNGWVSGKYSKLK